VNGSSLPPDSEGGEPSGSTVRFGAPRGRETGFPSGRETEAAHLVELIALYSRGHEEAFAELYDRTSQRVYGIILRVLHCVARFFLPFPKSGPSLPNFCHPNFCHPSHQPKSRPRSLRRQRPRGLRLSVRSMSWRYAGSNGVPASSAFWWRRSSRLLWPWVVWSTGSSRRGSRR
jgi:hypothetical protein